MATPRSNLFSIFSQQTKPNFREFLRSVIGRFLEHIKQGSVTQNFMLSAIKTVTDRYLQEFVNNKKIKDDELLSLVWQQIMEKFTFKEDRFDVFAPVRQQLLRACVHDYLEMINVNFKNLTDNEIHHVIEDIAHMQRSEAHVNSRAHKMDGVIANIIRNECSELLRAKL